LPKLSINYKQLSKLYEDNIQYLTDLYLYNKIHIEDKHGYLKSIFSGCLTATNEGYQTPGFNKLVSANSLSLLPLLYIESEKGLSFSGKYPIRVAKGAPFDVSKKNETLRTGFSRNN